MEKVPHILDSTAGKTGSNGTHMETNRTYKIIV